jgi:hypothetical protein
VRPACGITIMDESLALLLFPDRLDRLPFEAHARDLLAIPRVIALEPGRADPPLFMRDAFAARQASRIRLPGTLRMVVLYNPRQYPLARALCAVHDESELWYYAAPDALGDEFDDAARGRATMTIEVGPDGEHDAHELRERLLALNVINPRAFVPSVRFGRSIGAWRKARKTAS